MAWKNKLYFGDNLPILRDHIADESVDLVYLDPPFNSNANYNVLFKEHTGKLSHAQIQAFSDTWEWSIESETEYNNLITSGPPRLGELVEALRKFLKTSDMMAYLAMMAPRIVELHRVLKQTGSMYLHCDPTASHYLKLIMDAVFGPDNFGNELIWVRSLPHGNISKKFGGSHDTILFYRKSANATWNKSFQPHRPEYITQFYRFKEPDGRVYRLISCINPNPNRPNLTYEWNGVTKVWKYTQARMKRMHDDGLLVYSKTGIPSYKGYLDQMKGTPTQDVWTDIPPLMGSEKERLGYPTQKPEALMERILRASTNPGDVVLDPFCGCGTTIAVAEQLQRKWIGIDITHLAVSLMRFRLKKTMGADLAAYEVHGAPVDVEGASALAQQDRYEFQYWALGEIGAQALHDKKGEKKKGADAGIDGYIKFLDDNSGKARTIIISVKSGHVQAKDVRELIAVVKREKATIGVLLTLEEPTKPMKDEAVTEGFYTSTLSDFNKPKLYPKIQIITISELLEGKRPQYPESAADITLKAAPSIGHKQVQPKLL